MKSFISVVMLVALFAGSFAQLQGQASLLLDNLRSIGAIRSPMDPCMGISCGYGQYCEVINLGSSSVKTYRCRQMSTAYPRTVPQCYDKVEIRVPAVSGLASPNRDTMNFQRACLYQCVSDYSCGAPVTGSICCTRGCDRICYKPKTTIVDYTITSPAPWFYNTAG